MNLFYFISIFYLFFLFSFFFLFLLLNENICQNIIYNYVNVWRRSAHIFMYSHGIQIAKFEAETILY